MDHDLLPAFGLISDGSQSRTRRSKEIRHVCPDRSPGGRDRDPAVHDPQGPRRGTRGAAGAHRGHPAAVSAFPGENYQAPRSWTERAYHNLVYYNRPEKGGHFAAWEQPQIFAQEVRNGLRPLRT
jgi:hypothetical protein